MSKKFVVNLHGNNFYTPNEKIKIEDAPGTSIEEDFGDHFNLDCMSSISTSPMKKSMSMNDLTALREEQEQELSRGTLSRYHTSRVHIFHSHDNIGRINLTRPQSPMLREKEEMELEQMKKIKIKPQPVTRVEAFNHTAMQKKRIGTSNQAPKFKARPAPKHILEKPDIPVNMIRAVSPKPQKSKFVKLEPFIPLKPVKPKPFSFEKRNEELKKRKEEKLKCLIEMEKNLATSFKAQPVPGAVRKHKVTVATNSCSSTSTKPSENKENEATFKAKSPTVLHKEPFKPIIQSKCIDTAPFDLKSEKRAMERRVFERQLKEKEEKMKRKGLLETIELKEMQEKAEAELRAKMVHHAKPVPNLSPFIPERTEVRVTVPETPTFVRRLKRN